MYFKELRKHTRNMVAVTEFMGHIVNAKLKILNKLNSIKQLGNEYICQDGRWI